jgi:hypothetical protein
VLGVCEHCVAGFWLANYRQLRAPEGQAQAIAA